MSRTPFWARFFQVAGALVFVSSILTDACMAADFGLRDVFPIMAIVVVPIVGLLVTAGAILLVIDRLNRRDAERGGKAPSGDT